MIQQRFDDRVAKLFAPLRLNSFFAPLRETLLFLAKAQREGVRHQDILPAYVLA